MEESRKRSSFNNCPKEEKKEVNDPSYENERSLYKKEISLKAEEFKLARSNWVASKKEDETIKTNSKEGLNESSAYRGRFISLKKIGLNTTRLREHYQTVKPFRYFTLKPQISDTDMSKRDQERDQQLMEQDSFEEDTMLRDKRQQIWDEKESEIKELVDEAFGGKGTEKKKKKRRGPSKRAIENLKASKQAERLLETCKCNDGKEVTVVIKGFCLCDKGNLKTLKLNKINDDIKKLEKLKPEVVEKEEIEPHLVDSINLHRKHIERKSIMVTEERKQGQDGTVQCSKSVKSVSFKPPKNNGGVDNEGKSEKNGEKREWGMEGCEKEQKKKGEEEKIEKKIRKKQEEVNKEREETKKEREETKKEQEGTKKEQEGTKKEQEGTKKEREETKKEQEEKILQQEKRSSEKKKAESKKFQNTTDDVTSLITLFQNKSAMRSNMALTKEQYEKMQKVPE